MLMLLSVCWCVMQEVYVQELEGALARNVTVGDQRRASWGQSPLVRTLWRLFKKPLLVTGAIRLVSALVSTITPH